MLSLNGYVMLLCIVILAMPVIRGVMIMIISFNYWLIYLDILAECTLICWSKRSFLLMGKHDFKERTNAVFSTDMFPKTFVVAAGISFFCLAKSRVATLHLVTDA